MNNTPVKNRDRWIYAVPVLFVLAFSFQLYLYFRPGKLGLVIYYIGPLLITVLALIFLLLALIVSLIKRPFFTKRRMIGMSGLVLFPISFLLRADQQGNFFNAYRSSHLHDTSKVDFRLPLDTTITVGWGGDDVSTNYHVTAPEQRWAYDLLVTQNGKSFVGDSTRLESYLAYQKPVLAPATGHVVAVCDTLPDMRIGDLSETTNTSGNNVVLQVAEHEFLFLCHLKPHSVLVKKGDRIEQGQQLALVGNSGHTSEPHLHIHLQDTDDDFFGEGIPLYFSNYLLDGKVITKGMPTGGFDKNGNSIGQIIRHNR